MFHALFIETIYNLLFHSELFYNPSTNLSLYEPTFK